MFDNSASGDPYVQATINALKPGIPRPKAYNSDMDKMGVIPHRSTGAHSSLLTKGLSTVETEG